MICNNDNNYLFYEAEGIFLNLINVNLTENFIKN